MHAYVCVGQPHARCKMATVNKPFVVFNPRLNFTPLRSKSTRWQCELSEDTNGYVRVRTVQNSTLSENYKRWKGQMEVYLAASNAIAKDVNCNYFDVCMPFSVRGV